MIADRRRTSIGAFERLSSAARIEAALGKLGVPVAVPPLPPSLQPLAGKANAGSGPQLLAKMRNAIVHPTPAKRRFLSAVTTDLRFDALQLGLSYLELGILSAIGYSGKYVNRLQRNVCVAQATHPVPWV